MTPPQFPVRSAAAAEPPMTERTTLIRVLCPSCGMQGLRVSAATVRAHVDEGRRGLIPVSGGSCCGPADADGESGERGTIYRFCDSAGCDVVYFAEEEAATFTKGRLRVPVGVKETTGERPLCYCFGHSVESIKRELLTTGRSEAPKDIRRKMRDLGCRCETTNPSGSCCLGDVARGVKAAMEELQMTNSEASEPVLNVESPAPPAGRRSETAAKAGAVLAAVVASSCCWLPLALLMVGVSGAGIASTLEAYRPAFIVVTFGFLAAAFYFTYRPRRAAAGSGDDCCGPEAAGGCPTARRSGPAWNRVMLWGVTAFAVAVLLFPSYVGILLGGTGDAAAGDSQAADVNRTALAVEGMTCEGCAAVAAEAIRQVPGVLAVEVDYEAKRAVVTTDAQRPVPWDDILEAVRSAGYKGTFLDGGGRG